MVCSVVGSRNAFGEYLRDLRKKKGISSPADLFRRMNGYTSVSGILKRERGELKITEDFVDAFIKAVPLSPNEEASLRQHLNLFRIQFDLWSADKSILDINIEAAARLQESSVIKCFSPTIIPHVMQVSSYTAKMLTTYRCCSTKKEIAHTVKVRSEIARRIRTESHRSVRLINSEAALYSGYGDKATMIEQLTILLENNDSAHLQYRIIPHTCFNLPNDSTFTIYDDLFVTAESTIGNLYTGDKNRVTWAAENFERLWHEGLSGEGRNLIIKRALRAYLQDCGNRSELDLISSTPSYLQRTSSRIVSVSVPKRNLIKRSKRLEMEYIS